jgi:hypothetical protein
VTARTGIVATDDAARLLATEADCVVYTAVGETRPRAAVAEIAALLRSGKNVVSTSMMNLIHPASANPKVTGVLEEACTAGGTTLFTNGIDPGFSGDLMPLAALALCERVESIRVQELADYGTHPDASWATPFGFGQPPDAAAPILLPGVPTLFWGGMVRLLAQLDQLDLEQVRRTGDVARRGLDALAREFREIVKNVRGAGVMLAFDLVRADLRDALLDRAFRRGLILLAAGERTVRFYPRYDTTPSAMDDALAILRAAIEDFVGGSAAPAPAALARA